jgi:hypothetical protein
LKYNDFVANYASQSLIYLDARNTLGRHSVFANNFESNKGSNTAIVGNGIFGGVTVGLAGTNINLQQNLFLSSSLNTFELAGKDMFRCETN